MTLADEDTNSILTDNANRAIQGNVRKSYLVRKNYLVRKSYLARKSFLVRKVFLWECFSVILTFGKEGYFPKEVKNIFIFGVRKYDIW